MSAVRGGVYLTDREREILLLVAEGYSNADIGRALEISRLTVGNRLQHVYLRLGSQGRANTIWLAVKYGLLDPHAETVA